MKISLTGNSAERARFYLALQVAQIAWVGIALAVGGALAIDSLPLYIATMSGMLLILALASRQPTYARLRKGTEPDHSGG